MNVLFLSLLDFESIAERNIYTDLLREFRKNGHNVFAVSPVERRNNGETHVISEENVKILKVKIGNIQKTGFLEKGLSTVLLERQLINAVKKYFSDVKFDLVLYPTPPITLLGVVEYVKKRDSAKTYLMLKDIFPQGAVDLGILSTTGLKGIIYKYFRSKEKKLYMISDHIGCMSQANVNYVIAHNDYINPDIVHVLPNAIEPMPERNIDEAAIRKKYNIPIDVTTFIYGGNLGKPQGIPFIIECLKENQDIEDRFFVICGSGTEYYLLNEYVKAYKPRNVLLINGLPKANYEELEAACDVGLIFLDHRFTIPNFPSRMLSYMQAGLPVLACTDTNTDIGKIIVEGGFGWWCESDDYRGFSSIIQIVCSTDSVTVMNYSKMSREYLLQYYNVYNVYDDMVSSWKKEHSDGK